MKQGTAAIRVVIAVAFAAVLVYLGVYLWQGLSDPYQLVATYSYEMDDDAPLSGVVIRTEQTIPGWVALAEVLPQEGERVSAGSAVARIYQDQSALLDHRQIRSLELELEQIRYAMGQGDAMANAKDLDAQLLSALARLRCGVSTGSLGSLEEQGLDVRSLVLKRTGQGHSDAESLARLQQAADALEEQIAQLSATALQSTQRVTVDQGGIFSGMADGYEATLTPQILDSLSVQSLDQLRRQELTPPENSLGKLITDSTWYFAATLDTREVQRVEAGKSYTLAFSGDFGQEVSMKLERLGEDEGGRCLAIFSSDRYLNRMTLSRFVNARLVFQRYTGIRVPDKAIRVRTEQDGSTTPVVYTLVGRVVEIKPVEIIREGEGFYLVRGTAENRKVLRSGDVLVLSNRELYEGKVVA